MSQPQIHKMPWAQLPSGNVVNLGCIVMVQKIPRGESFNLRVTLAAGNEAMEITCGDDDSIALSELLPAISLFTIAPKTPPILVPDDKIVIAQ